MSPSIPAAAAADDDDDDEEIAVCVSMEFEADTISLWSKPWEVSVIVSNACESFWYNASFSK